MTEQEFNKTCNKLVNRIALYKAFDSFLVTVLFALIAIKFLKHFIQEPFQNTILTIILAVVMSVVFFSLQFTAYIKSLHLQKELNELLDAYYK